MVVNTKELNRDRANILGNIFRCTLVCPLPMALLSMEAEPEAIQTVTLVTTNSSGNSMDAFFGVLNADGLSSGLLYHFPQYVASTDSFGNAYTTMEDTSVGVSLHGAVASCDSPPCGVSFFVSTLPVRKQAY